MGVLVSQKELLGFMKFEAAMIVITYVAIKLGDNWLAILGGVATVWGLLNQYTATKRNIDKNHGGNVKEYVRFLVKFGGGKSKTIENEIE